MANEESGDVVRRDRFSGGPARGFLSSLGADERIFAADLAVDRGHVVMLAEQGIVADDEAAEILAALEAVEEAGFDALPDGEDVHAAIETAVVERAGPVGGKMHTARSRNDEVATCIRYRLREDVLDAVDAALALREALAETASQHVETVMPGYTHLQPAQPTTVAHYLLSYEQAVARDTERLFDAYARVNRSPLGAAAFAGTPFDVDRERTAELLGFDGVVANSMDAVSARDFLVEVVAALSNLAVTVSGLAEDLVGFSKDGLAELDDGYASTSSIMPQKKNPDTLELVRATAGDAAAGLNGLLTTLKGLPRAYNRDLQKATPHAWETVDAVTEAVEVAAGAVATASWDEAALADAAGDGFSTATGVADLLAMSGVPFRTAHEVVAESAYLLDATTETDGSAGADATPGADAATGTDATDNKNDGLTAKYDVLTTENDGKDNKNVRLSGGTGNDADAASVRYAALDAAAEEILGDSLSAYVDPEAVEAALDPAESVAARDSTGGPAPAAVETELTEVADAVAADADAVADLREALSAAEQRRSEEVSRYA